jgi:hypothetical protein
VVAEQFFEWAGFIGVHLRIAAFFMENVLLIEIFEGPTTSLRSRSRYVQDRRCP